MTRLGSRWSRNDSVLRSRGTRLTATVTISAPEALCAAFISSKLRYLPVPMINRERNSLPAKLNESDIGESRFSRKDFRKATKRSAAADEMNDLDHSIFLY